MQHPNSVAVIELPSVCVCGRVGCRYALDNGECAMELAEEGPQPLSKLAEVFGMAGESGAEFLVKSALRAFVRRAIDMGMADLVVSLGLVTLTGDCSDPE